MKKKIYYAFMILPLLIAMISLFFLPDQIPMHYGANGMVDRYGSKFETLLFPAIIIIFGTIGLITLKYISKKENNDNVNNEKVTYYAMLGSVLLFNVLFLYFLYTSFTNAQNLYETDLPMHRIILPVFALFLIVVGNIMPKTKLNSMIGLRTPWSMKNEVVWKKCQKFGGRSFVISGLIILIASLFFNSFAHATIFLLIIVIADGVISAIYSYLVAKKDNH